jgi:hypothetical protein
MEPFKNTFKLPQAGVKYPCPCCGRKTLIERGAYEICPVCFWEDDGQDDQDADRARGGPNGALSLTQARQNFLVYTACAERFVSNIRPPSPEESEQPMTNPDPDLQLITVFESDDPVAFNLAKAALEDAGIEFAAVEEALTGYGFSPMVNAPCKIQVAEPSRERALEVIQTMSAPVPADVVAEAEAATEALPEGAEGDGIQP